MRMGGDRPKQFLPVGGEPLLFHTLASLRAVPFLSGVVIAAPEKHLEETRRTAERALSGALPVTIVPGGAERQESVANALAALPQTCGWVMVHDAVRPFGSPALWEAVHRAARRHGAAVPGLPAAETVKRVAGAMVLETLPREALVLVQTPQGFRRDLLFRAYLEAARLGLRATDDASLVEALGEPVAVVPGERENLKITTPWDLRLAAWLLGSRTTGGTPCA